MNTIKIEKQVMERISKLVSYNKLQYFESAVRNIAAELKDTGFGPEDVKIFLISHLDELFVGNGKDVVKII